MAALRQSPSFKVVKLVEGNAASSSGQSGEGEWKGGWGVERRLLGFWLFGSENEAWRQDASTLGLIWPWLRFRFSSAGAPVPDDTIFSDICCHLFTLETSIVGTYSWPGSIKQNQMISRV